MSHKTSCRPQAGFTLVELMVALVIGLFITAGLVTLVQAMKRTTTSQAGLSQLQDNERMAMNLVTNAVQSAGYYPNPKTTSASSYFTAISTAQSYSGGQTMASGQSIAGQHGVLTYDQLVLRYASAGNDGIINCAGGTVTAATTWTQTLTLDGNGNLECIIFDGTNTSTVLLVNGITNFQVQYGVQTNAAAAYNSVDTYLTADLMTAAYWGRLRSVVVTLTFKNPLAGQPGQSSGNAGATIPFSRAITVMNKTGVDT